MTWIVPWNGKDYDVDPTEFSGLELKQIKLRTGLTYKELIAAVGGLDGEAICAIFWTVDRRTQGDIPFDSYAGPPMRLVIAHLDGFNAAMEELGKAMGTGETKTQTTQTDGGPTSLSSTPEPSTEPSTTA